ncbi:MAG: hypothetical protein QG602_1469 [Verrucomicrobiota bacterium]|nr:hypothetical protein [Verrucomicrobiota bacterium]
MKKTLRLSPALVALLTLWSGCNNVPALIEDVALDKAPAYTPVNHRGDARLPADVQRVAVLPIHAADSMPVESAVSLDAVLLKALQQQTRFEVIVVSRAECHRLFGADDFSSVSALPHGFLETISSRYAVDAVLFTDVTTFQAYRPLTIGYRSKLATVRDIRLVWAFDEVFSADDPKMRNSMRQFYKGNDRSSPSNPLPSALQSPSRFGAVAADLMFRTLPPR